MADSLYEKMIHDNEMGREGEGMTGNVGRNSKNTETGNQVAAHHGANGRPAASNQGVKSIGFRTSAPAALPAAAQGRAGHTASREGLGDHASCRLR